MKQLYKIVIRLLIFITCLFKNPNNIAADRTVFRVYDTINTNNITWYKIKYNKISGSLACVNMRLDNVRTLYDNIKGNDIYIYVKD